MKPHEVAGYDIFVLSLHVEIIVLTIVMPVSVIITLSPYGKKER